jgi:hypothetical protein
MGNVAIEAVGFRIFSSPEKQTLSQSGYVSKSLFLKLLEL